MEEECALEKADITFGYDETVFLSFLFFLFCYLLPAHCQFCARSSQQHIGTKGGEGRRRS